MKILVTGTPGSGKTTLVEYANNQKDMLFFDTDSIAGLCEWKEFKSGKLLGLVTEHEATGDEWYAKYGWYWNTNVLTKFLSSNPNAILCGSSENITDCYKYFDKIFLLRKTEEELLLNLQSPRRINPFGKTPQQRKNFLNWQRYLIKEAGKYKNTLLEGNDISLTYKSIKESIKK